MKTIQNWETFNEQQNNVVILTFKNIENFNKANRILYDNNFKGPTSMEMGSGYYRKDDNWKTINFDIKLEDVILPLLSDLDYDLEYKKPMDYKILNQGGYLD